MPARERSGVSLTDKHIELESTKSDTHEYLDLFQIEILQEDFIKFIFDQI
ncbi:hypothetical protein [uncultured Gilliamella sp.]|jgi:hypothetical protein|nr:hypothetical protein [uncultured Gilliamella sp.]